MAVLYQTGFEEALESIKDQKRMAYDYERDERQRQMRHTPEYQAALSSIRALQSELKQMRKEDKQAQRFLRKASQLTYQATTPDTAEALALLADTNLEWSSDLEDIKTELANLIKQATLYPSLRPVADALARKIVYGED